LQINKFVPYFTNSSKLNSLRIRTPFASLALVCHKFAKLTALSSFFYNGSSPFGLPMVDTISGKVNLTVPKIDKDKYEKIINIVE